MRYIGSKTSVLPEVHKRIAEIVPNGILCDPFGGIGAVGSYFKSRDYRVITGDILLFPHYFQVARIENDRLPGFREVRRRLRLKQTDSISQYLNSLKGTDGWLVREYARKRKFFTVRNARKIQSLISEIGEWAKGKHISEREKAVLLASLISSIDEIANTAGTYYAYLKQFHRKALRDFSFQLVRPEKGRTGCKAYHCDALTLVNMQRYDILYIDPPYNARSYGHYYHLPETLAHQVLPKVQGKSGIPKNYSPARSDFNKKSEATRSLEILLSNAKCKLIAFHYADDGLIEREVIRNVLAKHGAISECVLHAPGYTTTASKR